jgi:hypothetical protein
MTPRARALEEAARICEDRAERWRIAAGKARSLTDLLWGALQKRAEEAQDCADAIRSLASRSEVAARFCRGEVGERTGGDHA